MKDHAPADFTVGVEEEYQLVAEDTGDLRSRARAVLDADWTGEIQPEMQQNTVEVRTRVCHSGSQAMQEMARLRLQASIAAEASGLRVVAAGTHPFSDWPGHEFTQGPTYQHIREEYRQLAESQQIFGMHVHVAIPADVDRAVLMNTARWFLPHLLALSASSPYFLGEDTGYASFRTILWRRWPRSGPPPRLESEAEYRRLVHALIETGMIDAPGRMYWEIRPHHLYPTLEFRVCDVTPRLADAALIVALVRIISVAVIEGVIKEPRMPESHAHAFLIENDFRASRDGLAAELADPLSGVLVPRRVGDSLLELAERVEAIATVLGEQDSLDLLPAALQRGDSSARLRRWRAEKGSDMAEVVRWLADETVLGLGLDRRLEQRTMA